MQNYNFTCFLYGCETWFIALREEHRLRMFENRMLRRVFGPKSEEVTGGRRKLHNKERLNLYSLPNIIRVIKSEAEICRAYSMHGKAEKCT
jgi:hypothetical protein